MERPVSFGYKMAWLAVRSTEPVGVLDSLGVTEAVPASWQEGIDAIYSSSSLSVHPAFITPELDGWLLIASPGFFDEASDSEPTRLERFVTEAAKRLGTEVQFFATHRAVEGHAWAWADRKGLKRAFFYLGETDEYLLDSGAKTPREEELKCLDPGDEAVPDESTVMSVAREWSLDPTGLDQRAAEASIGYLGLVREPAVGEHGEAVGELPSKPWWRFW